MTTMTTIMHLYIAYLFVMKNSPYLLAKCNLAFDCKNW